MKKLFTLLIVLFLWAGSSWGQTTITCTGTAGSYKSGSVSAAGVKNDGAMVTINSSANRGWANFDLTTIPAGAIVTAVSATFTTYTSTSSSATNNLYGFTGDPATMGGAALYTACGTGSTFNNTSWTANAANTKVFTAAGIAFVQANCGSTLNIGYVRASTNTYNIYGYNGTPAPTLIITYTVPPPCSGTPAPGNTISSANPVCSGVNFTLSLQNATSGLGVTYQWQSSPTGSAPWTNIGTSIATLITSQVAATYYQCAVTCSGSTGTSTPVLVAMNTLFNCYCASGASSTGDEDITLVQIGSTLNNTSACASLTGSQGIGTGTADKYTNFTSIAASDIAQGTSAAITVQITECAAGTYGHDVRVYFDWNQNGLLTDVGEEYIIWPYASATTHTINANIAVPLTATLGNTLMRVVCKESSTTGPCLVSSWGETEDYVVNLIPAPSCLPPGSLLATTYGYQANLSWTEIGTATLWDIEWGPTPFTPTGTPTTAGLTNPNTILTGLTPVTGYAYYVRSNCGGTYSTWSGPKTFTTTVACPAPTTLVSSAITTTEASVNWTSTGLEAAWDICYGPTGFVLNSDVGYDSIIGTSTKPYLLTSLLPSTGYSFYVRASCGVGSVSAWSTAGSFTTACAEITTFPYNQTFEGAFPPACWTRFDGLLAAPSVLTATTSGWIQDDYRNVTSPVDKAAKLNIWTTSTKYWLVTPAFVLTGSKQLEFDLSLNAFGASTIAGLTGTDDKFAVVISTDGGTTWTSANTLRLWDNAGSANVYNNISPTGEHITIDLNAYSGSTVKIGFYGESTVSNADNDLMVNNVAIQTPLACPTPNTLTAVPAGHQAILGWTEAGTALYWDIEWGASPFTPTGTATVSNVSNPYTLLGLAPSTGYTYYVRANCGGNYSPWSVEKSFTTTVSCPAPSALTFVDILTNKATANWTSNGIETSWDIEYGPAGFVAGSGTGYTEVLGTIEKPYNLTGLSIATAYDVYVRASCGEGEVSAWSAKGSFTTLCDVVTAPFLQDFEAATFAPVCWANTAVSGTYTWTRSTAASANGGGAASAYANFYSQTSGTYDLKTMQFDISGLANPILKFNWAYATYAGEVDQMDVYYSTDAGINWVLLKTMPGGAAPAILNTGGTTTGSFVPTAAQWGTQSLALVAGTNMIKFTAISAYGNNLFLDNVQVYSPLAHDVATAAILLNDVVNLGSVTPTASVKNEGENVETFDVTMTIGGYSSTKTVTALAAAATQVVTFDPWTATLGDHTVQVCTSLTGDLNAANDCQTKAVKAMDLNKTVYGYYASSATPGPVTFNLATPGTFTQLADQTGQQFISGGTWANGIWYGVAYNTVAPYNLLKLDIVTGARTVVADMGINMNAIAYNIADGKMYGCGYSGTTTSLYTINMVTGVPTLVGDAAGVLLINLAIDKYGAAYSLDLSTSSLGTVNLATGAFTPIGNVGFIASYAQDMEFDRETGELYMAAYGSTGQLRLVNKTTGGTLVIGQFQGGAEITGFAIPFTSVTFNVDMSTANSFTPGVDMVYMAGNFPGASWNEPGTNPNMLMAQVGTSLIYTKTMALPAGTYAYKYFKNATWANGEYAGGSDRSVTVAGDKTVNDVWGGTIEWANLQWPASGTITVGGMFDVWTRVYIPNNITAPMGATTGLTAWIGYSTSDTDPSTWTNWVAAPFSGQQGNDDEYWANIGSGIATAGTYYYASRLQYGTTGTYVYGGYNAAGGGFWDGTTNVSGVLTVNDVPATKTLNLKAYLQGFWNGTGMNQAQDADIDYNVWNAFTGTTVDTLSVLLADAASPFDYVYQAHGVNIGTDGAMTITIPAAFAGSYYIAIQHRSSVETWSFDPVSFGGGVISYDFTTAAAQAFGSNQLDLNGDGSVWGLFGGEVYAAGGTLPADGYIDINDLNAIYNENVNAAFGYMLEDINGDGFVDINDLNMVYNNNVNAIGLNTPVFPMKKSIKVIK
jgi:hypothetical protein